MAGLRFAPLFIAASLALGACSTGLDDARYNTGTSSIVSSSDYEAIYAVNVDEGTVSRVDRNDNVDVVEVGLEPTRIARANGRVLVTLRGEGSLAVLSETSEGLVFDRKIEIGAEPYGVVATENGKRVYVSLSMEGRVVELDGDSLEVLRSFQVEGEPRWLAVHPDGRSLYVGSAFGGTLSWIKLGSGDVKVIDLPMIEQPRLDQEGEFGFDTGFGFDEERDMVLLSKRITGDLAISADGIYLAVPVLFADNESRVIPGDEEDEFSGPSDGYASAGPGPGRMNPSVVTFRLGSSGKPKVTTADPIFVAAFADVGGVDGGFQTVRSYISSVVWAPNGLSLLATMEGSGAVVAVPLEARKFEEKQPHGFSFRATAAVSTDDGPTGVAFLEKDRAFVHSFLDRTVADVQFSELQEQLRQQLVDNGGGMVFVDEGEFGGSGGSGLSARYGVDISESTLPWEVEMGRKLFYAANDSRMVASGGGVSCATCHYEGRNDGLTWNLHSGLRNTPTLAGDITATAPVTWTESVPSVADEAVLTTSLRMGGHGLTELEAGYIQAFVDSTRTPQLGGLDPEAVARGQAIFESAEAECSTCHTGATYSDNEPYDMFGIEGVRTRTLVGIGATAPYFHDGSAPTLRDAIDMAGDGEMGRTVHLSDSEKADLEAYLKSL